MCTDGGAAGRLQKPTGRPAPSVRSGQPRDVLRTSICGTTRPQIYPYACWQDGTMRGGGDGPLMTTGAVGTGRGSITGTGYLVLEGSSDYAYLRAVDHCIRGVSDRRRVIVSVSFGRI